jgi:hypothetical protein
MLKYCNPTITKESHSNPGAIALQLEPPGLFAQAKPPSMVVEDLFLIPFSKQKVL